MGKTKFQGFKVSSFKVDRFEVDESMAANTKTSITATLALVLLGLLVLVAGEKSLILLIPAAALVWYKAAPRLRSGRN
jgi:hypothetical protein